jgi:hypothetical protein
MVVFIASTAPIDGQEVQKGDWQIVAQCAAAYRANAQIADPSRTPSMKAMITDQASDYEKAAIEKYSAEKDALQDAAQKSVAAYIEKAVRRFAQQPRSAIEKFIDGCPQV